MHVHDHMEKGGVLSHDAAAKRDSCIMMESFALNA
jgi:hypothetical protein